MATPEIRFEGFEDEWEEEVFEQVFSFLGTNTLSRASLNYQSGIAKNVHYGDVLTFLQDVTYVDSANLPFISDAVLAEKYKHNKLQNGDVVIADTAEDETVGKATEIQNVDELPIYSGLHTFACRPYKKFAPGYLGHYFNAEQYHGQIVSKAQGTKVSSISKNQLQETLVSFPVHEEQLKVSKLFGSLDRLIETTKKSSLRLKKLKKSMLVKMFPQDGASVPEIRFEGFTSDWKMKTIENIAAKTLGGGTPATSHAEYWNGNIPWIQSSDLSGDSIENPTVRKWVSETGIKNSATMLIPENSIAVVTRVGVGKVSMMLGSYATSQDFISLVDIKGNLRFITIAVKQTVQASLSQLQGSTIKGITRDELISKKLRVPSTEEQAAIGSYFRQLDQLIELEEAKLVKLTQLKTAFLSKMFV